MAEKSVDGKGFVFFTEVFVRIQVYPSKEKRTIKKVLHVNSVSSLAAERQLPGPCEQDNVHVILCFFVGVKCWEREMIHVQLKVVSEFNRDVHMRKLDRDGRN
ncbi:unnamed protein product [Porites evermanni]|uniref:Uncharacterized protein n=1 Tax=Porites evermanni TaxID=104178 RepID=A0ABN8SMZ8_9CNID|nr:unnamed protein product [Porites evermanni]